MIATLLVGVLTCASAAPQRAPYYPALPPFQAPQWPSLSPFQAPQWPPLSPSQAPQWSPLSHSQAPQWPPLSPSQAPQWPPIQHFPSIQPTEGIVGNDYRITIPLTGFEEKDIIVKARKGSLKIQAVHSGANLNIYSEVRPLPMSVGEQGSWSYENGVLKIVLRVVQSSESGSKEVTPEAVTPVPDGSREETENPVYADGDIDLASGDLDKTSEIPTELPEDVEYVYDD